MFQSAMETQTRVYTGEFNSFKLKLDESETVGIFENRKLTCQPILTFQRLVILTESKIRSGRQLTFATCWVGKITFRNDKGWKAETIDPIIDRI